jgi:hypothetical protein
MSSSRLSYDVTSYDASIKKSTDPLAYHLAGFGNKNCGSCFPDASIMYPKEYNDASNPTESVIEVENVLSNRDWKNDKKQFGSHQDTFQALAREKKFGLPGCSTPAMRSSNSLLTNPRSSYRELSTEHLVFIGNPIYPQDYIPNARVPGSVSSRDVAVDLYRKIVDKKGGVSR